MKNPKKSHPFECEKCEYTTGNKKDFDKHLMTAKHINRTLLNTIVSEIPYKFVCKLCNKKYKARNSLWYHEQKCNVTSNDENKDNQVVVDKEFVMNILKQNQEVMKQNAELQNQIEKENKIIKKISKEIIVDKQFFK